MEKKKKKPKIAVPERGSFEYWLFAGGRGFIFGIVLAIWGFWEGMPFYEVLSLLTLPFGFIYGRHRQIMKMSKAQYSKAYRKWEEDRHDQGASFINYKSIHDPNPVYEFLPHNIWHNR